MVSKIKVERQPNPERLKELGVKSWPIWTKEASEFPWTYDEPETCYFLEGEVTARRCGSITGLVEGDAATAFPKPELQEKGRSQAGAGERGESLRSQFWQLPGQALGSSKVSVPPPPAPPRPPGFS
jgi:hypothetical protein